MKLFYPKFAWDAIRKNRRSYIPYTLATLFVVTVFHFPMVRGCLSALEMTDTGLFLTCVAICCGVFALVYLIVYFLTSKIYYHIVNQKQ